MKGLNYKSTQTYSYQKSNEEMRRILECDGFKNFKLYEDQKIIEYTIDNSMQIKLSLLLYLQDIKFIRLSIAQNIQLCLDILMKYKQLKELNIQHNYINSDRIIINITDKQSQITILPEKINYTIHFLGYDCPFYERPDYINTFKNDDQSIKEIIINILQFNKRERLIVKEKQMTMGDKKADQQIITDQKKREEKQKKFNEKYKDLQLIFKALLDEGIFKSFDQFIDASNLIFGKYNNKNNKNQRLSGVDKNSTKLNSKRLRRIDNVNENLIKIQECNYKQGYSYEFQQILQLAFPLIAEELTTAKLYYSNQYPVINDDYINLKQQLNFDNKMIEQMINENKEEIMKDFKFDLDFELIKEDICQQLKDNKQQILNYFLNDVKFSISKNREIQIQIDTLKQHMVKEVTIQSLQNYLELKILQLIQDLI
ncbi:unnamed protein product [Paramecium primaurelia]|uniref:Uncharacterized protein n=1 Tax=Paramecium primaurelia TaxID=5886 RepID=A0A8S1M5X5_PARPR|nr:unnamed protein product [Paramecium primaurelia]